MRSLMLAGLSDVRHVGATGDGGADLVAMDGDTRWVVQVKSGRGRASTEAIKDLERAAGDLRSPPLLRSCEKRLD